MSIKIKPADLPVILASQSVFCSNFFIVALIIDNKSLANIADLFSLQHHNSFKKISMSFGADLTALLKSFVVTLMAI